MDSSRNGYDNIKTYREYEIVDIDTGELLKNINNKEYITINYEERFKKEKYVEKGYLKQRIILTRRRFVKHRGQLSFPLEI